MKDKRQVIDPWASFEVKDYGRVIKEFGVKEMGNLYKKLPIDNIYFRRGFVFGHKDFEKIIETAKKKKPFVMMTGLMPSGKFHLGHKVIADLIIYFQKLGAECYVAVADIEAHLTRGISLEEARKVAIEEYLVNYIALGLKPKNLHFYFQSDVSKDHVNLSKLLANKTTFNELRNVYGNITPGKLISAFTQIADILHPQLKRYGGPKPVVVPVGIDQLPHINLTRDIAKKMSSEYGFILPSAVFIKMVPGLGGGKMSSSKPESYIALTDDAKTVEKKIKKYAFSGGRDTLEEHKKLGGNPDVDIAFQYLKIFFESDDKKLKKIYNDYKSGKLLSGELKQICIEKIQKFLAEHQKKREKAKKQIDKFLLRD